MKLSKQITVDYAHRLAHHTGQCANLHGHTGRIVVELDGPVDTRTGMVLDFGDIKDACKGIYEALDHTVVLNGEGDVGLVDALLSFGFRITVLEGEPTAENLARWVYNELKDSLPVCRVSFYETPDNWATYEGETDET